MKKYLFVLPLIASCSGLNSSNNVTSEEYDAQRAYHQNFAKGADELLKKVHEHPVIQSIAICGKKKPEPEESSDSFEEIHGLSHMYGGDYISFNIKDGILRIVALDGLGRYGGRTGYFPRLLGTEFLKSCAKYIKEMFDQALKKTQEKWCGTYVEHKKKISSIYEDDYEGLLKYLEGEGNAHKASISNSVASTFTGVTIDKDYKFDLLNIGDSGVIVVRDGEVFFKHIVEEGEINVTYSVGMEKGGKFRKDPYDYYTMRLKPKDCLIVATDGVIDNLSCDEIVKIIQANTNDAPKSVKAIIEAAEEKSKLTKHTSTRDSDSKGGKKDDMSVLVLFTK